jgi:hypothetical protein
VRDSEPTSAPADQLSAAARELLAKRLQGRAPVSSELSRWERSARPALSFGQQRLWFLAGIAGDTVAYHVPFAYRLSGELDRGRLERALDQVVDRHESLRTRFGSDDGVPFQIVDQRSRHELAFEDLSSAADPQARAHEIVDAEAERPFDLREGPLMRARLLRLAPEDHVLACVVHHIVFDRLSLNVWAADLGAAYCEAPFEPPVLPVQYADYAEWQQAGTAEVQAEHLRYWREQLAGASFVLELPFDRTPPQLPSPHAGHVDWEFDRDTVMELRRLARDRDSTLFAVGLTAYHAVLSRHTATEDIVVGCPAAGRTQVALEQSIGFFVNSLPVRASLRGDPPATELLARVHGAVLGAHAHQDAPFERIVEELTPPRHAARNPIFQVWFDLVDEDPAASALSMQGLEVLPWPSERVRTRFDLELHLSAGHGGTIEARLIYAEDLFDRETALAFAARYERFLRAIAEDSDQRISQVQIFSPEELAVMLGEWGAGQLTHPEGDRNQSENGGPDG